MPQNDPISERVRALEKMLGAYDRIMKLTERELSNAEEIITVYETLTESLRKELVDARETAAANESASLLGREEMKRALEKIQQLESHGDNLRREKEGLQKDV